MHLKNLERILAGCAGRRVAVVGDLMLDRYVWGRVDRVSPEAPVPVVSVERRSHSLGGSANVVHNLQSLGAEAVPFGVVGADQAADLVLGLLRQAGVETAHILRDDERPTTLKTRIIAHEQHVVRVDEERVDPLRDPLREALLERLAAALPRLDAVVFEDYDKGVLESRLIAAAREACRAAGVFTAVDPKLAHFHDYGAVDLFKPNQKEIARALGRELKSEADVEQAGRDFLAASGARELALTRGAHGMLLFDAEGRLTRLPALRSAIVDVSGAGDTVVAALVLARVQGLALSTAGRFASLCAAVACGELGAVPVRPEAVVKLNDWLD